MNAVNTLVMPRWLIPVVALGALLLVILSALGLIGGGEKIAPATTETAGLPVPAQAETVVVGRQTTANRQLWPGVVQSRTVANIAPKLTARIVGVTVNSGDSVKAGAVLVRLDERELRSAAHEAEAALASAQAVAARAQADVRRSEALYRQQAETRAAHDAVVAGAKTAAASVAQAENALAQIRAQLSEATLVAPFAGVIAERRQQPGDMAMPGLAVVTLLKADDLRLEVALPDVCAARLQIGQEALVRIDNRLATVGARIDEIAPELDRQTGTRLVKATLPGYPALHHGQFAWLELSCGDDEALLLIPGAAIVRYGQLETVRIVDGARYYTRHIRTGKAYGDRLEVLSGLRAGETVLVGDGKQP